MERLKLNEHKNKVIYLVCLLFAAALFLFTHLYKLDSILDMWNTDEVGLILNVQSLDQYGTDRYGNPYPMYPINYVGEQSPLFTYCYLIIYKLCGYSKFSIRMLTVAFSILATIYWGKIYYLLEENKRQNTLMMVLAMATFPSLVMLMRLGLDCNLMLTLIPVFFFYLLKAVFSSKKHHFVVAGIVAGIVLYTYVLSHIIMPLFLILLFVYLLRTKKISISDIVAFMVPVILLALPLIPFHIVNTFRLGSFSILGISYVNTPDNRNSEISLLQIPVQLIINLIPMLGFDAQAYASISYFGTIYWISVPFFILGLIKGSKTLVSGYKNRQFNVLSVVTLWFYSVYLCNSMILAKVYRLNPVYFAVIYLTIVGINEAMTYFKKNKLGAAKIIIAVIYLISFISFAVYYFGGSYTKNYLTVSEDRYCAYEMTDALNRVNELREEIGNRDLYIGNPCYINAHYQMGLNVDSREFYLNPDGSVREDYEDHYQNNYFYLVNDPWDTDIYMIDERDKDYCDFLNESGFSSEYVSHYYIFYK